MLDRKTTQQSSTILTGRSEHLLGGTETVGLRYADREPDDAEKEIEGVEGNGEFEHRRVQPRRKVVDGNGHQQDALRDRPDESTPFDVVIANPTGEVNLSYSQLRDDVVGSCLYNPSDF